MIEALTYSYAAQILMWGILIGLIIAGAGPLLFCSIDGKTHLSQRRKIN